MTMINWPDGFNWPYAGQPQDVPPQFARNMVKIQDQIFWLLNAIRKLNEVGVSSEYTDDYADKAADAAVNVSNAYADSLFIRLNNAINNIEKTIEGINAQTAITRNPVTGFNDFTYVALKQMWDILRQHTIENQELSKIGTYDDLKNTGFSYFEIVMDGRILLFGDDSTRIFATPESHINPYTPGYYADIFVTGTDYETLKEYGFLYSRKGA